MSGYLNCVLAHFARRKRSHYRLSSKVCVWHNFLSFGLKLDKMHLHFMGKLFYWSDKDKTVHAAPLWLIIVANSS